MRALDIFVRRPVIAIVLNLALVLVGLRAASNLPIQQYPTIAPVQIQVSTVYAGANAETVAQSVAAPIEAQINGVDALTEEWQGFDPTGANQQTSIYGLGTAEDGRTYGRIRVVECMDRACTWWEVEYRKRLVPNFPSALGRVVAVDVKSPTCVPATK